MTSKAKLSGAAIATAAALLFNTLAAPSAVAEEAKVRCDGVNACKGQSACQTASNACMGQNACNGQGYKMLTRAECEKAKAEMKK